MNLTFNGTLFDGENLNARVITLGFSENRLRSETLGLAVDVALAQVRTSDRLASLPRYLYLPDQRTIETPDNDAIDALLAAQKRGRTVAAVHWLEARARVAAVATLLLIIFASATIWWGLPVLARRAAMAVPSAIETQAGQTALLTLNQLLGQTQLKLSDRTRVEVQISRLIKAGGISVRPQLVFRSMGGKSPNAFALPGGFIVVSDELINLPVTDDELAAVLAHEIGHWQLRHGLQTILRSSSALLVVSTVTGDLSTLTTFAGAIPFTMLQRGYSREFESEADDYAIDLLLRAKIDVKNFKTVLEKLEDARPETGQDFTYLSTHPSTADRIQLINLHRTPASMALDNGKTTRHKRAVIPSEKPEQHTRPRIVKVVNPVYPYEMSQARVQGQVTVEFTIDEEGQVTEPSVIRSTAKEFEAPAIAAVLQWKFTPGTLNGGNIAIHASQLIEFNLDKSPSVPAEISALPKIQPPP